MVDGQQATEQRATEQQSNRATENREQRTENREQSNEGKDVNLKKNWRPRPPKKGSNCVKHTGFIVEKINPDIFEEYGTISEWRGQQAPVEEFDEQWSAFLADSGAKIIPFRRDGNGPAQQPAKPWRPTHKVKFNKTEPQPEPQATNGPTAAAEPLADSSRVTPKIAVAFSEKYGWVIFPADLKDGKKKSYKSAEHSDGQNWGLTKQPGQIREDFSKWPKAGIGVPAGIVNGVVDIETDTKAGHKDLKTDGETSLRKLEAELGPLPETLMFTSPTGSIHRIFKHPGADKYITTKPAAEGVDVKGDGGMFIAPPSVILGKGVYRWLNDLKIAELPQPWIDRLTTGIKPIGANGKNAPADDVPNYFLHFRTGDEEARIRNALFSIERDFKIDEGPGENYLMWIRCGIALKNLHWINEDGSNWGLELWDEWSREVGGDKYTGREEIEKKWRSFNKPNGSVRGPVTIATIFYYAKQNGWTDAADSEPEQNPPEPCSLDEVHEAFRRWLGDDYDLDAIDATCAATAAERLSGDPLWLLIVSGPGSAKTETVQALSGAGAFVISTIASEGALLSASSHKTRVKTATGGLLRKIGERGVLVVKDVTSILSADRNTRASVLAAIREIYDGHWVRNVGTDGGQTLAWSGRVVIVGAVTTAWDSAHTVVAAMGDRFVLLRINSKIGRLASGRHAIRNTGSEVQMRQELAAAVGGLIAQASTGEIEITESESDHLLKAADIVTMARTAVERDNIGEIVDAHAPEMPTRFAKQLTQLVRGGVAIGMSREDAMRLAIRCARDSIPPLRLDILLDIAKYPEATPGDVQKRINKPWRTTKREMEALHMLGVLACVEEEEEAADGKTKRSWIYNLAADFDHETLLAMAGHEIGKTEFYTGLGQANRRRGG